MSDVERRVQLLDLLTAFHPNGSDEPEDWTLDGRRLTEEQLALVRRATRSDLALAYDVLAALYPDHIGERGW